MKKKLKVVTVTLNPALDLTGSLNKLIKGEVNLLETGCLHPAGKGINVAKVLAELGVAVTVTGFLGEEPEKCASSPRNSVGWMPSCAVSCQKGLHFP